MSTIHLRASLALWRRRYHWRAGRLKDAHRRNDIKGVHKWYALRERALDRVKLRQKQLADRAHAGRQLWMPGATIKLRENAGEFIAGCKPKGVLHETQGHGDATSTLDAKRAWPHFEVTEPGEIVQYVPINRASRALEHPTGTVDTNRAGAIQIEISGYSEHPNDETHAQHIALRRLMRWIEANAGVKRACTVKFVGGGKTNHMDPQAWLHYDGWCGHQHVPNNSHWDPGAIDIDALLSSKGPVRR